MKFKELDTVVLDRDLPEYRLRRGDLGAVVQVYDPDSLEVEFVTAADRTQALVTLRQADVRAVGNECLSDLFGALPAVRPFPGKEEVRESVGRTLAQELRRKER